MYFVHPQIKLNKLSKQGLKELNQKLAVCFPGKQLIFTDMGRSAFKIIIEKLNLPGSEIMLPAYICDIFESILNQYNIKPILLDIDLKTFHVGLEEIKRKISPQTKAILVCHTYGLPVNIREIREVVGGQVLIIEDCAHSFGVQTGNSGDVSFFSLYKQFPTLRGGLLVCPQDWSVPLPATSFNFRDFISLLNCFPAFAFFFKKFGQKAAPHMLRKEKLLTPASLNKFSLNLLSRSLDSFEKSLENRRKLALSFQEELKGLGFEVQEGNGNVFCYLSALVPKRLEEKRDQIVEGLRKYKVFCTRIWHSPIGLDKEKFPKTTEAARRIINFPLQNHYTEKDMRKIIDAVKKTMPDL